MPKVFSGVSLLWLQCFPTNVNFGNLYSIRSLLVAVSARFNNTLPCKCIVQHSAKVSGEHLCRFLELVPTFPSFPVPHSTNSSNPRSCKVQFLLSQLRKTSVLCLGSVSVLHVLSSAFQHKAREIKKLALGDSFPWYCRPVLPVVQSIQTVASYTLASLIIAYG